MTFDIAAAFVEGWAESQIGEGGPNAQDNCVPTAFTNAGVAMGWPDIEPQEWTDVEYGHYYHGPEELARAVRFAAQRWNNAPVIDQVNMAPAAVLPALDRAAAKGWPNAVLFHSDIHGNIGRHGALHLCNVVRWDGQTVSVLNVAAGEVVRLANDAFELACAGPLVIFEHPVRTFHPEDDMTNEQADTIAAVLVTLSGYADTAHREVDGVPVLLDWVAPLSAAIRAGNIGGGTDWVHGFINTPEIKADMAADYARDHQPTTPASPAANPQGDTTNG